MGIIKTGENRVLEVGVCNRLNGPLLSTRRLARHRQSLLRARCWAEGARSQSRRKGEGVRNVRPVEMDAQNIDLRGRQASISSICAVRDQASCPTPVSVKREMHPLLPSAGPAPNIILNQLSQQSRRLGSLSRKEINRLNRSPVPPISASIRSRNLPAFSGEGEPEAGVDREGEHPSDLVRLVTVINDKSRDRGLGIMVRD